MSTHSVLQRLDTARGARQIALLTLVLSLPALRLGLQADDHMIASMASNPEHPVWDAFTWTPERIQRERDRGGLVWWTSPRLQVDFLRPLTSVSHMLEFRAGTPAWLMLLVNVALYSACVWLAVDLYRRVLTVPLAAPLAGLAFALDPGHALSVGWISARNTLLAACFALLTLRSHIEFRRSGRPRHRIVSCVWLLLALASAEAGTWAVALLVAYAAALDTGTWRARMTTLLPPLALTGAWAAGYAGFELGVRGASWYRDTTHPLLAVGQGLLDLPLWSITALGPGFVTAFALLPTSPARLLALPLGAALLAAVWSVARRDPGARFCACAAAFCLVPLFWTVPQDRVAIGVELGACGWLGSFIAAPSAGAGRWVRRGFAAVHIGWALVLYPWVLGGAARPLELGARALAGAVSGAPHHVLINGPVELLPGYAWGRIDRERTEGHGIRSLHQLYAGGSGLTVERVDARTIDLRAERGWGHAPIERIFCALGDLPGEGVSMRAIDMDARVLDTTADGRPARVRFRFATELESAERRWFIWRDQGPVAWQPPAIGERDSIAGTDLLRNLPQ